MQFWYKRKPDALNCPVILGQAQDMSDPKLINYSNGILATLACNSLSRTLIKIGVSIAA
jgi:hypothetical protein